MTGLLDACNKYFDTTNLYEVLGTEKTVDENALKRAYHRVSLKVHPDRVPEEEKQEATAKFQTLGKVYAILSDEDRRAVYDETGEVDDENAAPDRDWDQYWRLLFKKITVEDIRNFEESYKESEEELGDLKAAYLESEGDIDHILDCVLCCSVDDEPRFRKIINGWIKKGDVPKFDKFTGETKQKKAARKRKAAQEAREAEEMKKEFGLGDTTDSLQALILKRGQDRKQEMDGFLDSLAAKYGGQTKKGRKSKK